MIWCHNLNRIKSSELLFPNFMESCCDVKLTLATAALEFLLPSPVTIVSLYALPTKFHEINDIFSHSSVGMECRKKKLLTHSSSLSCIQLVSLGLIMCDWVQAFWDL